MNVSAYLRHPFLLLALVSLAIGFVWYALGLPVRMPPGPLGASEKLACVSYTPEADGEIASARIEADLALIARHASCVRTYRTGAGLDRVPEIAARLGLTVLQGIALGRDADANRAEIERAAALAGAHRSAIRAFVLGDRALSRRDLRAAELALLVRQLRARTKRPVTSVEFAATWLDADLLAAAVDFIMLRVPLYDAAIPVAAADAARHVTTARAAVAAKYPDKAVTLLETGWPGAGRMREAAQASFSAQALVLHGLLAAAKAEKFELVLFEGIDQPGRAETLGTSGAHWGLIAAGADAPKFRWGGAVVDHPLWFTQATMGILFAFVIFAAGWLAARSMGPGAPAIVTWEPVALIALGGGAFIGWAVADLPAQSHSIGSWALNSLLLLLALAVPPLAAAASVRGVPFEGFSALLDSTARRAAHPLARASAGALTLTVFLALAAGLILAVDPEGRDFPFAPLTGPAAALLVLSVTNPAGARRESVAETGAALALAAAALLIVFNETFWNWQALWTALALTALALACRRAASGRMP